MALSQQASKHSLVQKLQQKMRNFAAPFVALMRIIGMRAIHITRRQLITAATIAAGVAMLLYITGFFWPRAMGFSYSGANCFFNPMLLPKLVSTEQSAHFAITTPPALSIGNYPVFSAHTCVTLTQLPQDTNKEMLRIAPFGNAWIKKTITVSPGTLPTVEPVLSQDEPAAPDTPLLFTLSQADAYFDYRLDINGKQQACNKNQQTVSCDLGGLALMQSANYPITLERLFNGAPTGPVLRQTVSMVEPVTIAQSSIAAGEKVFGVVSDIVLTFSKPLNSFEGLAVKRTGQEPQDIGITPAMDGQKLVVRFNEALPRDATYELILNQVKAQDGSRLPGPYTHQFATSGGPKVQSISIGSARVQPDTPLTITFDAPLAPDQDLQNFIRVESGGSRINAVLSAQGKSVTITPRGLNRCSVFNIQVIDGLRNFAGITGGSAWGFTSRTVCQTTFSIGTSVQGRSIIGYRFGNGPEKIIIVGTLHGNEKSATNTLNSFINQLEASFERIPAKRTIIVIPNANPDGFAANTRTNANNVDLNRNFPAHGWKSGVTMPNGTFLPAGGGVSPLSEPESRSLANFIAAQGARLVLSYHSVAGLVAANEAGDSLAIARLYGQKSNFPSYGNEASGSFHYDTTGAFEDWLRDAHSIPGLLVELSTQASNEISRHQNALWAMVQLQ